jgi:hypothetical protein
LSIAEFLTLTLSTVLPRKERFNDFPSVELIKYLNLSAYVVRGEARHAYRHAFDDQLAVSMATRRAADAAVVTAEVAIQFPCL